MKICVLVLTNTQKLVCKQHDKTKPDKKISRFKKINWVRKLVILNFQSNIY